jgi:hypothetical protein
VHKLTKEELDKICNTIDSRPRAQWHKKDFVDPIYGTEALDTFPMHHIRLRGTDWSVESWENPDRNEFGLTCSTSNHKIELIFSSPDDRRLAAENMFPDKPLYKPAGRPHGDILVHTIDMNRDRQPEPIISRVKVAAVSVGIAATITAAYLGIKEWRKRHAKR